jgi:hypothetical protein
MRHDCGVDAQLTLTLAAGQLLLRFDDLRLLAGLGTYRMSFPFVHRATWLADQDFHTAATFLLTGSVWSASAGHRFVGSLQPRCVNVRGVDVNDNLFLDVSSDQLAALNATRLHSDLELRINIEATWLDAPPDTFPTVSAESTLRVNAPAWSRLLDDNNIELTVAIRVPLSMAAGEQTIPTEPSHTRTVMLLREARSHFREGQYRAAAVGCRTVLESLEQLAPIPTRGELAKSAERNPEQRWAAVHIELKNLLNPAAHEDANSQTFEWGRLDVESILAAVAAVVARTLGTPRPTITAPAVDETPEVVTPADVAEPPAAHSPESDEDR